MKKILIVISFVLCLCSPSYAYYLNNHSFYTHDKLNGVCWISLNEEQKETLLFGFKDGIKVCISTNLIYGPAGLKEEETRNIPKKLNFFITSKGSVSNTMKYLNKFYSNTENLQIPILEAFVLMVNEARGLVVQDAQRNEIIKNLRELYKK